MAKSTRKKSEPATETTENSEGGQLIRPQTTAAIVLSDLSQAPVESITAVAFGHANGCDRIYNFDPSDVALIDKAIAASAPPDIRGADAGQLVFPLKYWAVGRRAMENPETGEMEVRPWLALIDADGKTLGCQSQGAIRSLEEIVRLLGPGPYDPPLPVLVKHTRLSGNRPYYILIPQPEATSR